MGPHRISAAEASHAHLGGIQGSCNIMRILIALSTLILLPAIGFGYGHWRSGRDAFDVQAWHAGVTAMSAPNRWTMRKTVRDRCMVIANIDMAMVWLGRPDHLTANAVVYDLINPEVAGPMPLLLRFDAARRIRAVMLPP